MSSVYWPLPVMKRISSRRRTGAPMPVAVMMTPPPCGDVAPLDPLFGGRPRAAAHGYGAGRDRLDDVVIAGAAADVAFELLTDRALFEMVAEAVDHVDRRHDHSGSTEAALQPVVLAERLLHRMQLVAAREPLNGQHVRAVRL